MLDKKTLRKLVGGKLIWYEPDPNIIARLGDGGVAIVDQWIAAHSKYDWHYVLWAVKNNKCGLVGVAFFIVTVM